MLRQGKSMAYHEVRAGDIVSEFTGIRQRLESQDQNWVIDHAKTALRNMIAITESDGST